MPTYFHAQLLTGKATGKLNLGADSLALLGSAQVEVYLKHIVSEVLGVQPVITCFVDNRSHVQSLHSTNLVKHRHMRTDIAA